jgi:copper chaperone CopZ
MSLRLLSCLACLALSFPICGCTEATNSPAGISAESATPVSFNTAGAPTIAFSVPDMMCPEGCGVKTKQILAEQSGVKDVMIDFESKTATVAIEEGAFDSNAAIAALVDHGFDHSTLKEGTANKPIAKPQATGSGVQ